MYTTSKQTIANSVTRKTTDLMETLILRQYYSIWDTLKSFNILNNTLESSNNKVILLL